MRRDRDCKVCTVYSGTDGPCFFFLSFFAPHFPFSPSPFALTLSSSLFFGFILYSINDRKGGTRGMGRPCPNSPHPLLCSAHVIHGSFVHLSCLFGVSEPLSNCSTVVCYVLLSLLLLYRSIWFRDIAEYDMA